MRFRSRPWPGGPVGPALVCVFGLVPLVSPPAALAQQSRGDEQGEGAAFTFAFDLEFAGGSLDSYLRELHALGTQLGTQGARPQNIVCNDWQAASEIPMPTVSLRAIGVSAAVELVERLVNPGPFQVGVSELRTPESDTYVVTILRGRQSRGRTESETVERATGLEVFSLADLVEPAAREGDPEARLREVIAAVTTALEIYHPASEGGDDRTLKYHADTNLLFFKGGDEETALVATVLERLREGIKENAEVSRLKAMHSDVQERLDHTVEALKRATEGHEIEKARHQEARAQLLELERAAQRLASENEVLRHRSAQLTDEVAELRQALEKLRRGGE